jgi:hypothetical protein
MSIALLTSGATLGTHVPALILANRLRGRGAPVHVEVFERLLPPAELDKLRAAKAAFRADFRMAVAASRLIRDQTPALDPAAIDALLRRWHEQGVDRLVAFSGFWVPIIERYLAGHPSQVDICHLDAAPTSSFRLFEQRTTGFRHVWMFDAAHDTTPVSIPVTDEPPVPWAARAPRVLAHGGGWGLGTYRDRAVELAGHGIAVDVVGHAHDDLAGLPAGCRMFLVDPAWEAWQDGGFAPFGQRRPDGSVGYRRGTEHHDSFDLARQSVAMVCKTGGGTLLDSLWSATPVVLLEPFGAHERVNADMWHRRGFGLTVEQWRATGFSLTALERLHDNLVRARKGVADYPADLL